MAIKKTWYEIIAPPLFGEQVIGETPAVEPKSLIGRVISVNLIDLGKEYSKFYLKMLFRISHVDGTRAYTKLIGHDCTYERIYRMVQRRARRVDCIQDVTTADGIRVRLKSILILTHRVGTSIKDAARACMAKVIERFVAQTSFEDLIRAIITDKLQRHIREECKKIYPIGAVEVRKSEMLGLRPASN